MLALRALIGIAGVVVGVVSYPTGHIVPAARTVPTALIVVGALFVAQAILDFAWAALQDKDAADAKAANETARTAVAEFESAWTALDQAWRELSGPAAGTQPEHAGRAEDDAAIGAFSAALGALNDKWATLARLRVPSSAVGDEPTGGDPSGTIIGVFVAAIATVLGLLAVFGTGANSAIRLGALVLVIGAIVGLTGLLYASDAIGKRTASLVAWIMSILFGTTAFGLACIGFAVYFH